MSSGTERAAEEFAEALQRAKLEALEQFAAGAGHEINNPVATISARAQMLLKGETDPERRRMLAVIGGQALRIRDMIGDLMLFARPPVPEPQSLELSGEIESVIDQLREVIVERNCRLEFSPGRRVPIFADSTQLRVVIGSLLRNSLEAIPDSGGVISVDCESVGDCGLRIVDCGLKNGTQVAVLRSQARAPSPQDSVLGTQYPDRGADCPNDEISTDNGPQTTDENPQSAIRNPQSTTHAAFTVTDNGCGLSEPDRRHLFDPFYSGRQAGRGLGFGLCKCWRIVSNHGGRIDVESDAGRTVFRVLWPAAP